jgi:translation elongation factor EF-1alpha
MRWYVQPCCSLILLSFLATDKTDLLPAQAEVVFEPMQPLIVDSFKNCEGLSRIAFLDGNTAVMLGKVVACTAK